MIRRGHPAQNDRRGWRRGRAFTKTVGDLTKRTDGHSAVPSADQGIGEPIHHVMPCGSITPALRCPYGLSSGADSETAPAASARAYASSQFATHR